MTNKSDEAFAAWWPRHAVKHNSRSPVAAREAFDAGWDAAHEHIKAARAVSACCGAEHHREPGRYGRWQCHACGSECDLIGVIG